MKKLLLAFGLLAGLSGASWAANNPIYGVVQITTSTTMTPPLQSGAFNVSSGTVQNFTTNSSTASSFNATVSSITNITTQNFTAVTSTSTNFSATTLVASTLTATNVVGQITAVAAPVGDVGEIIQVSSYTPINNPINIATGQKVDVATATVTAGCWQITWGYGLKSTNASTSMTEVIGSLSTTANTTPSNATGNAPDASGQIFQDTVFGAFVPGVNNLIGYAGQPVDFCIASPTTYYVVVTGGFTVSTAAVYGNMHVRRIR